MAKDNCSDWVDRAVLIYGARKSGTTLLQNLVDGGELLVHPMELKIKAFLGSPAASLEDYVEATWGPRDGKAVVKNRVTLEKLRNGGSDGDVRFDYDAFRQSVAANSAAPLVLSHTIRQEIGCLSACIAGYPKAIAGWCAKEVGNKTKEIVELWTRSFPEGRVLFIVRDPKMTARSVLLARKRNGVAVSLPGLLKQARDPFRVNAAIASIAPAAGMLVIRYEDLVANPRSTMQQVCAYLGMEFSETMLVPTLLGRETVVRTAARKEYGVFSPSGNWKDGLQMHEKLAIGFFALWDGVAKLVGLRAR